jgi:hypothetical protein
MPERHAFAAGIRVGCWPVGAFASEQASSVNLEACSRFRIIKDRVKESAKGLRESVHMDIKIAVFSS